MKVMALAVTGVCAVVLAGSAVGRDIHVNHETGNDRPGQEGGPLKTIAAAIRLALPGDTIHLAPTQQPYKEGVWLHNRSGEPGRPICLDGHGATLSGAEPLDPNAWKEISPGLFRNGKLIKPDHAVVHRFFFLFDGKMNRMGRSLKGPKAPFKKPEDLNPGEWTWQQEEQAFYVRVEPGKALADCRIEAPARSSGVAIAGHCEHLVIRNLVATHVWNDGYNIHGKTRDVLFENIKAIECGDDGLSAHDDCEVRVNGFVSIGNSTGVCNVGDSRSVNDRLVIKGCHGYDFYMLGSNTHVLRNSVIICDAAQSVVVIGRGENDATCTLKMENVLVKGTGKSTVMKAHKGSVVQCDRTTIYGLCLTVAGNAFTLRRSVVAGQPRPNIVVYPHTTWEADGNLYDLQYLRIDKTFYAAKDLAKYRSDSGQDVGSMWSEVAFREPFDGLSHTPPAPSGVGIDPALLPVSPGLGFKPR